MYVCVLYVSAYVIYMLPFMCILIWQKKVWNGGANGKMKIRITPGATNRGKGHQLLSRSSVYGLRWRRRSQTPRDDHLLSRLREPPLDGAESAVNKQTKKKTSYLKVSLVFVVFIVCFGVCFIWVCHPYNNHYVPHHLLCLVNNDTRNHENHCDNICLAKK